MTYYYPELGKAVWDAISSKTPRLTLQNLAKKIHKKIGLAESSTVRYISSVRDRKSVV